MARPRKKKTGVMVGFPKLAFYIGPSAQVRIPRYHNAWTFLDYILQNEELVVLVAQGHKYRYSAIHWRGERYAVNYYVPIKALEGGSPPITCIYNWKRDYQQLPALDQKLFRIIEKDITCGEGTFKTADAV